LDLANPLVTIRKSNSPMAFIRQSATVNHIG
jgi:hypothetical protein